MSTEDAPNYDGAGSSQAASEEYHLIVGDEQLGPHSEAEVRSKIAARECRSNDLYWTEGMDEWATIRQSPFADALPPGPPPAPEKKQDPNDIWPKVDHVLRSVLGLHQLDWRPSGITCGIGVGLALLSFVAAFDVSPEASRFLMNMAKPVFLLWLAQWLILLYRLWRALPEDRQKWITARMVVGLMFVPLVNLIWLFFIYYKLMGHLEDMGAAKGTHLRTMVKNYLGANLAAIGFGWHWLFGPLAVIAYAVFFCLAHRALVDAVKNLPKEAAA